MRMKKRETLDEYVGRLNGMCVKYSKLGATLDDAEMVQNLFDTMANEYYQVITGIEQFCDLDMMSFEEAVG